MFLQKILVITLTYMEMLKHLLPRGCLSWVWVLQAVDRFRLPFFEVATNTAQWLRKGWSDHLAEGKPDSPRVECGY